MPNYNEAQGVADLLSQFDFNIISEGPGDFSTSRKYTCEFSKPGIESFTTTYQSNPRFSGQPTATDVFAALASDALAVDGRHIDDFADEMGFEKPSQAIRAYESCRKTLDWLKNGMQLMTSEISDIAETLGNEMDEVKEEVERVQAERKAKHEFEHPPVPDGTRHGMTAYRDFDDMMGGPDSVFKDCEIGKVWDENGSLFIHGYHHDGGVDVEVRQLTDAGEEALDVIEDAWVGESFTINDKEYDGSWESVNAAMRELWENPALCPSPRYMELAFGCPAVEYEAPVIDPLLETAEFTSSAIMSAEVAPGAASATVHDVAGVPYEVPADVLNGLKDAVRISDRAATTTLFTSLTIAGWTQKGDESAKASPVSLKAAAKEARESSAALAAHGASTIDLEHEVDNAQKASETLFDADGDR